MHVVHSIPTMYVYYICFASMVTSVPFLHDKAFGAQDLHKAYTSSRWSAHTDMNMSFRKQ